MVRFDVPPRLQHKDGRREDFFTFLYTFTFPEGKISYDTYSPSIRILPAGERQITTPKRVFRKSCG
jgi:hypothetical protein